MLWGIDISRYQAGIDLHKTRAEGHDFVIMKASQGVRLTSRPFVAFASSVRGWCGCSCLGPGGGLRSRRS